MIDIILPIYQKKKSKRIDYMHMAIMAILGQTFRNWSLYMVDDASPHDVEREVSVYRHDPRVVYHRSPKNSRLPTALNIGHSMGEADYCMWNCDDDWKEPTFLEEMLKYIQSNRLDFVNCQEAVYDKNLKFAFIQDPRAEMKTIPDEAKVLEGNMGLGHLYKRRLWENNPYDEKMFCIEDLDFYYQIAERGAKMGFLDKPLHNTIRHPWTATAGDNKRTQKARERFIRKWRKRKGGA